jgi:hypothetical protein
VRWQVVGQDFFQRSLFGDLAADLFQQPPGRRFVMRMPRFDQTRP